MQSQMTQLILNHELVPVTNRSELKKLLEKAIQILEVDASADKILLKTAPYFQEKISYVACQYFDGMYLLAFWNGEPMASNKDVIISYGYVYNLTVPEFSDYGSIVLRKANDKFVYSLSV